MQCNTSNLYDPSSVPFAPEQLVGRSTLSKGLILNRYSDLQIFFIGMNYFMATPMLQQFIETVNLGLLELVHLRYCAKSNTTFSLCSISMDCVRSAA